MKTWWVPLRPTIRAPGKAIETIVGDNVPSAESSAESSAKECHSDRMRAFEEGGKLKNPMHAQERMPVDYRWRRLIKQFH